MLSAVIDAWNVAREGFASLTRRLARSFLVFFRRSMRRTGMELLHWCPYRSLLARVPLPRFAFSARRKLLQSLEAASLRLSSRALSYSMLGASFSICQQPEPVTTCLPLPPALLPDTSTFSDAREKSARAIARIASNGASSVRPLHGKNRPPRYTGGSEKTPLK